MIALNPCQAARSHGQTVIGALARDDLFLGGLAAQVVVIGDQLHCRVIGIRAGIAEEHARHVRSRNGIAEQAQQTVGQPDRRFCRGAAEEMLEAEGLHCLGPRLHKFRAAIADIYAPQARAHIQQGLATVARHLDAGGGGIDLRAVFLDVVDRADGVEEAELVQFGKRDIG